MKLVINLEKSKHTSGLVLQKVAVMLPNGKMSFANRWVQPNKKKGSGKKGSSIEQSTENKSTVSPFAEPVMQDDMFVAVENDYGAGWEGADGNWYPTELDALVEQYEGNDIYRGDDDRWHIEGEEDTYGTETQAYRGAYNLQTSRAVREPLIPRSENTELQDGIRTVIDDYMKFSDIDSENICDWVDLNEISEDLLDFYGTEIISKVRESLPTDDSYASTAKRRVFELGFGDNLNPFAVIGSDPEVLKTVLNGILGEDLYKSMRSRIENSTLSINAMQQTIDDYIIPQGQYVASSPEEKLKRAFGDEALDRYYEICGLIDDSQPWEDVVAELSSGYRDAEDTLFEGEKDVVKGISRRTRYEQKNMGIRLKDPKPVYIAYNIGNYELGGQDFYGDSWMELSEEVIKDCTVSRKDSYYAGDVVGHIHDMNHLHDLSILKVLSGDYPVTKDEIMNSKKGTQTSWEEEMYAEGDVGLELHYHKPSLSTDLVKKYHGA